MCLPLFSTFPLIHRTNRSVIIEVKMLLNRHNVNYTILEAFKGYGKVIIKWAACRPCDFNIKIRNRGLKYDIAVTNQIITSSLGYESSKASSTSRMMVPRWVLLHGSIAILRLIIKIKLSANHSWKKRF